MEHESAAQKPEPLKVYALSSFRSWLERAYPEVCHCALRDKLRDGSAEVIVFEFDDYAWTKEVAPELNSQLERLRVALGGSNQVLLLRHY